MLCCPALGHLAKRFVNICMHHMHCVLYTPMFLFIATFRENESTSKELRAACRRRDPTWQQAMQSFHTWSQKVWAACMQVKTRYVSFLHAIGRGDGAGAARNLLCWSNEQTCPDPEAFVRAMAVLGADEMNVHSPQGIDLDRVIKTVLVLCRQHEVHVHSKYASLLLGACILVGFATGLDPQVNLMDAAIPSLLTYDLTGRLIGRLYS